MCCCSAWCWSMFASKRWPRQRVTCPPILNPTSTTRGLQRLYPAKNNHNEIYFINTLSNVIFVCIYCINFIAQANTHTCTEKQNIWPMISHTYITEVRQNLLKKTPSIKKKPRHQQQKYLTTHIYTVTARGWNRVVFFFIHTWVEVILFFGPPTSRARWCDSHWNFYFRLAKKIISRRFAPRQDRWPERTICVYLVYNVVGLWSKHNTYEWSNNKIEFCTPWSG